MIVSFKHKGLKDFFETGSLAGIQAAHENKLRNILNALSVAKKLNDINPPNYCLHKLAGNWLGYYSIKVNENWRIIFKFVEGNVYVVDYLDYH